MIPMAKDEVPPIPTPLPYAAPPPRRPVAVRLVLVLVLVAVMLTVGAFAWHALRRSRYSSKGWVTVRAMPGPEAPSGLPGAPGLSLLPSLSTAERRPRTRCADNLRRIAAALQSYANAHDWRYPDRLEELVESGLLAPEVLACPAEGQPPYAYAGRGLTFPLDPDTVLLHERSATSHLHDDGDTPEPGLHVLLADGRTRFLPARQAAPLLAAADRPGPLTLPTTRPH